MTVRPTPCDAGSLMLIRIVALSAATGAAVMTIAPAAVAQARAPVNSSVFVHPYDTGDSTINDNFQYIAHPPLRQVAASEPAAVRSSHRGRRGQAGAASATGGGTNNAAAVPLPTMPAAPPSGTPDSQ